MNCVWPMAPAHEPFIASSAMSPCCRILSAVMSWGRAKLGLGAGAGERGERPDDVLVAGLRAVIRLDPPNGDDDVPVDAIARLQRVEQRLVLDRASACRSRSAYRTPRGRYIRRSASHIRAGNWRPRPLRGPASSPERRGRRSPALRRRPWPRATVLSTQAWCSSAGERHGRERQEQRDGKSGGQINDLEFGAIRMGEL